MFDLNHINNLLETYDGNRSSLFPLMRDRILEHVKKSSLPDGYECMLGEFMFFEYDYFIIKRDLIMNGIKEPVIDIGAQFGYQSELFLDHGYVGVERFHDVMFNEDHPNVSFIKETFPSPLVDVSNKVVISNMSISFFYGFISQEKTTDEIDEIILESLTQAKILYFKGTPHFTDKLKKHYTFCQQLYADDNPDVVFSKNAKERTDNEKKIQFKSRHSVSDGLWKFWN